MPTTTWEIFLRTKGTMKKQSNAIKKQFSIYLLTLWPWQIWVYAISKSITIGRLSML